LPQQRSAYIVAYSKTRSNQRSDEYGGSESNWMRFITEIADDAAEERRRAVFDILSERARTLGGRLAVDQSEGTTIVLELPASSAVSE